MKMNSVAIYYVNSTSINQQVLKVKILATCFSYSEPSSGQKTEHSSGTFSDCAHNHWMYQNYAHVYSVFGLMMTHC